MIDERKIHFILTSISIISCIIAGGITWYLMETYPDIYREVNPVSAMGFESIGMIPTFFINLAILTIIMIYIPKLFGKYKKISITCNSCFAIIFISDAGNNLYYLLREMYWIYGNTYQLFTPTVILMDILYSFIGL